VRHVLLGSALAACVLALGAAGPLQAQISVNTVSDELNSDGDCSLREAVRAANSNAAVDGCAAGQVALDEIQLGAGTFLLTIVGFDDAAAVGDLDLTGDTRIVGLGSSSSVISGSQGFTDRVFQVLSGSVELVGLGVLNGQAGGLGGGIHNAGTLTLNSVVLDNNLAHASGSGEARGGGIYNTSILTINNSIFVDNRATAGATGTARGGGIHNDGGTVTLNSSTVTGNRAFSGALGTSQGGGIYTSGGSTTLNSTTPSGNTAVSGTGGSNAGPNTFP
jgi:CSLREA domain-containing protein